MKKALLQTIVWLASGSSLLASVPFSISEFLAVNSGNQTNSLRDEDGDSSDWIEIFNSSTSVENIGGWFLTDAANNPTKWRFPEGFIIAARSYFVVFASGKDRTNTARLHTNFQLSSGGEYLALLDPNTNVLSEFSPAFPPQQTDVSYGRDRGDPNISGFYTRPTPAADNATSGTGFASKVRFSRNGGTFVGSLTLTLSAEDTNDAIRFTLVNTAGNFLTATNIPTSSSLLYTGAITIANTVQVRARAFSTKTNYFPGPPHTESYIVMSGSITNLSSSLPLVVIHTLGTSPISGGYPAPDNSVIVACFDNTSGRSSPRGIPQVIKRAGINIRGGSTAGFAVEFWDEFNDDDAVSMLGLPEESDWILYAPNTFDRIGLHNPLMHHFERELGHYSSRTRFVEVFFHNGAGPLAADVTASNTAMGDYNGIYVLEEKVKRSKNRVNIDKLEPEQTNAPAITGGYLLRIDRADPDERTFVGGTTIIYQDPPGFEFVPSSGQPAPGRIAQSNYLWRYLNLFGASLNGNALTNATGTNHYSSYLDVPALIDHHIVSVLILNADGYVLSCPLYKPRNGKLTFGPLWDADRSQGSGTDLRSFTPLAWSPSPNNFFAGGVWLSRLFADPDLWQQWIDRYQQTRTTVLETNRILSVIDTYADELREASPREIRRWAASISTVIPRSGVFTSQDGNYSHTFPSPGTFQGEVDFQKRWYLDHVRFIDSNLLARPSVTILRDQTAAVLEDRSGKPGTKIYYTLDGSDPRGRLGTTNASAREYEGPILLLENAYIRARAVNAAHRNMTGFSGGLGNPIVSTPWSGDNAATFFVNIPTLRVTELMYHPAPGPNADVTDSDDYEYIELKNVGSTALNLTGFKFVNGITFDFTGSAVTSLAPGGYVLIVKNLASFASRYGARANIAGAFSGNLDNSGERITLVGTLGEPILDFTYNDRWYPATDGNAFALITVNENAAPSAWNSASNWRASRNVDGSPGVADPVPQNFPVVLINEVLTHTGLPSLDAVELFNTGTTVADIGGWYLSDDPDQPQKYFIPIGTTIPARGSLVFYETNKFNLGATNFALSSEGDEVYLFSATDGNLTGYSHGFDFGAAANGVSFGRYINSQGAEHFVAQASNTLGASNSLPRVGPVVISEFMYHPPDNFDGVNQVDNSLDEFIELHNISGTNVALTGAPGVFEPDFLNTWAVSKTVDFKFPTGVTIPANGYALIVNFDPSNATQRAAFVAKYSVPTNTPIFGPYGGKLDNSSGGIKLSRPDTQGNNGNVPYIEVDQVDYTDSVPWPTSADGIGLSLNRITDSAYGNDAANWAAARPTPGAGFVPGTPPTITQQPQSFTVIEGTSTNLSVTVSGTGPFSYQWRFNGNILPGATSATLAFPNPLPGQSGIYSAIALNGGGAAASVSATVTVRALPVITLQPGNVQTNPGSDVTFKVNAAGTGTLNYQWHFNGTNITGANATNLTLTNVQLDTRAGFYSVLVSDDVGSRLSQSASLIVLVKPVITNEPALVTVVQGGTAAFRVIAGPDHPVLPLNIRWLREGTTYIANGSTTALYTNIQPGASVRVQVTNLAGSAASPWMLLTVLPDADGDGTPDEWEVAYGLNPTNAADGGLDSDRDGMLNRDEYLAGTDPNDPRSYLKIEPLTLSERTNAIIEFNAVSNKSYTVQFSDALAGSGWSNYFNVLPEATNRVVRITNSAGRAAELLSTGNAVPSLSNGGSTRPPGASIANGRAVKAS